jgi:hypothetical protein
MHFKGKYFIIKNQDIARFGMKMSKHMSVIRSFTLRVKDMYKKQFQNITIMQLIFLPSSNM